MKCRVVVLCAALFSAIAFAGTVYESGGVDLNVPPSGTSGTTLATILVPDVFSIEDINVFFHITHTEVGDLIVSLTSPDGREVVLMSRVCQGRNQSNLLTLDDAAASVIGSDCTGSMNGTFRPQNPLSGFNGLVAQGTWTLTVRDMADPNHGKLHEWSLDITGGGIPPSEIPEPSTWLLLGPGLVALGLYRRKLVGR